MTKDDPTASPLEWLIAQKKPDGSEPPATDVVLLNLRRLSPGETKASVDAIRFVNALTLGGALQELRETSEGLFGEVESLESRPHSLNAQPGASLKLEVAFKAWLSAFVSYADRTKHWISQEFGGKETHQFLAFNRWLSEEFDANFGYRLCCALRNAAQHAGRVINRLSFNAYERGPLGVVEEEVILRLDCPALARQFPAMPAKTRAEMLTVTAELELEWIVHAVIQSCQRTQARLYVALRQEILRACEVIEKFDSEVGGKALFETTGYFDFGISSNGRSVWKLRANRGDLAAAARDGLLNAKRMLTSAAEVATFNWWDFVDDELVPPPEGATD